MTLREQLDTRRSTAKDRFAPQDLAIMRRATEDLRNSGIPDRALKVGDPAPAWESPALRGSILRSRELLAKGPLVLTFFRGVW
ncbi:MAG TPA: hypothetical protein VGS59_11455 [Candidatus Acidoferrales bacterium]|nr:hypothetical protein [Candidatus Acidoferrales bacterium]